MSSLAARAKKAHEEHRQKVQETDEDRLISAMNRQVWQEGPGFSKDRLKALTDEPVYTIGSSRQHRASTDVEDDVRWSFGRETRYPSATHFRSARFFESGNAVFLVHRTASEYPNTSHWEGMSPDHYWFQMATTRGGQVMLTVVESLADVGKLMADYPRGYKSAAVLPQLAKAGYITKGTVNRFEKQRAARGVDAPKVTNRGAGLSRAADTESYLFGSH